MNQLQSTINYVMNLADVFFCSAHFCLRQAFEFEAINDSKRKSKPKNYKAIKWKLGNKGNMHILSCPSIYIKISK